MVLAVVVVLVAAPAAGALGTAVHDARSRVYEHEARTRHDVTATAIEDSTASAARITNGTSAVRARNTSVRARGRANGAERTGNLEVDYAAKAGDSLQIWVDDQGNPVGVAMVAWETVVLAAAAFVAVVRSRLDRARDAGWEREIRSLVDGGRTNRQP